MLIYISLFYTYKNNQIKTNEYDLISLQNTEKIMSVPFVTMIGIGTTHTQRGKNASHTFEYEEFAIAFAIRSGRSGYSSRGHFRIEGELGHGRKKHSVERFGESVAQPYLEHPWTSHITPHGQDNGTKNGILSQTNDVEVRQRFLCECRFFWKRGWCENKIT